MQCNIFCFHYFLALVREIPEAENILGEAHEAVERYS